MEPVLGSCFVPAISVPDNLSYSVLVCPFVLAEVQAVEAQGCL
jgi:hypothetical protein